MKTIPVEGLAEHLGDLVDASPVERILLTRQGKPFALVTDASNLDEEDLAYIADPDFWEMMAARRKRRGGIPVAAVKARIAAEQAAEKSGL